ncbi:hypothetical protein HPB52_019090 [Rhipicephalus sanguineus]|uniref:Uncharacterized protein n=1 Tax=Rhipicephalus sanguineus TaxID=34632 RepID=A0A9D4PZX3_RHISA|nr:hypothetical protein HPB52_019090 [Rhipicephalus sanguineus]
MLQTGRMEPIISALTEEEEEMFRNMMRRVHTIAKCGECTRWCYLDETAFTSLADAEEASFVCKLREKVKAAVQRMEACIEELNVEREQRIELQASVRRKARATRNPRRKQGKKGDLGAAVAHVGTGDSRRKSYSDVAWQSSGGTKQGAPAAVSLSRVGDTQRTGDQRARTGSQQSQAGSERLDRKRVLVVGDPDVARVEQGVLTTVKADRRVKVEAQSGKCMTDAGARHHSCWSQRCPEGKEPEPSETEDGVRKLREASEGVHVTICTIPEVWGQSGGMERRVIETVSSEV